MNKYEMQYLEKKKAVLDCLSQGQEFMKKHGYDHEAEMIQQQAKNVEDGEFSIVLVGEFSAGKSTFLNALMGERILPSYSSETTATVNLLQHKSKAKNGECGRVFYRDGTEKELLDTSLETITRYVATNSNEDVAKNIKHLTLYLDSKFLENNVTLVDSPGLNGIADGHREITMEQIEKSSASIFLFNSSQPGKKSDFDFLTDLRKRVKSIIFVLNQIDRIKYSEGETVEKVVNKLKENYKRVYPDVTTIPEIWPVSARQALDARNSTRLEPNDKPFTDKERVENEEKSRIKAFEERLWKFLTQGEKAKSLLATPIGQLTEQLTDIKDRIQTELEILSGEINSSEVEAQKFALEKQREDLESNLKDRKSQLSQELRDAAREVKDTVNAEAEALCRSYQRKLDSWQDIDDIEPENIERDIARRLEQICKDAEKQFKESVSTIIDDCERESINTINEKLPESSFSFKLSDKIEDPVINFGIEAYDEKIKAMEEQLESLEEEEEKAQDDFAQALDISTRRSQLSRELAERKAMRENYLNTSANCIPEKRYIQETVFKKETKGGLFGCISFLLNGHKRVPVVETIVDTEDRDAYLYERERRVSAYDSDINALKAELEQCGFASAEIYQRKQEQLGRKRQAKQEELERIRKEFREQSEKKIAAKLRRLKSNVSDFIEDQKDACLKEMMNELKKLNEATTQAILDVVAASITAQIDSRTREIELLEEKMNLELNEKNQKIIEMQGRIEEIKHVLSTALEISDELEAIDVDEIKEDAI